MQLSHWIDELNWKLDTELINIGSLSLNWTWVCSLTNRHWVDMNCSQRNSHTMSHKLELNWETVSRVDKGSLDLITERFEDAAHDCCSTWVDLTLIESQRRDTITVSTWIPSDVTYLAFVNRLISAQSQSPHKEVKIEKLTVRWWSLVFRCSKLLNVRWPREPERCRTRDSWWSSTIKYRGIYIDKISLVYWNWGPYWWQMSENW